MIHVLRWDPAARCTTAGGPERLPASAAELTGEAAVWVDLENPTPEEEDRVLKQFLPVHPLTLEDATKPRRTPAEGAHLPKVEEFQDYLFVIVNPLPAEVCRPAEPGADGEEVVPRLGRLHRPQLSAVLTHHVLVTHYYEALPVVADARGYAVRHADCVRRGPDFLFHLILDEMVDEYAPVIERIADRLDGLEARLFKRPSRDVLVKLLRLKRQVSFLRKTLILEREVLARLTRGEFALVDPREIAYYRNVYDHVVRYAELIESAREMVSDLMQTHLSATSNRLNEVMKVLTMISTVVLPMTLVAGVYGMNFDHMPELHEVWGYPVALGLMAVTGIGSFALFRWKGWF
jgi:magnesium transporter